MKVSLFVHSLGTNPIVRAKPVADALAAHGCEVEVLGFLVGCDEVYAPYRDCYDYKVLRTSGYSHDVFYKSFQLAGMATGEIVYAFKPLLTSFFPALVYSGYGRRRKLLLDVEDDDVFARGRPEGGMLGKIRDIRKADGYFAGLLLDRFVNKCSAVTVSSVKLSYLYGGRILLNGPAVEAGFHEIGSAEQERQRVRFGLPLDRTILLFAGKPRWHKGMDVLMQIVTSEIFAKHFHLVLVGDPTNSHFKNLKKMGGESITLLGQVPHREMCDILATCDLVPVIQRREPYAESQIPAKLLEAMAYGRPSIVSAVGDLPRLVGNERGWLLEGEAGDAFEQLLRWFAANPVLAKQKMWERGRAARNFYESQCSPKANAAALAKIIDLVR